MDVEPVIGLEIHVQLNTRTKLFCACDNAADGATPNTHICEICTGQPGTLPVPNEEAIQKILRAGMAAGSELPDESIFDRKQYFYPDLPKGYQISQYEQPFCVGGHIPVRRPDGSTFEVELERMHLEEDAGKLVHEAGRSGVDLNRAGTPLIECVTKPVIQTAEDARLFLQTFRRFMRYIGVSDADMEKGQLRCDANISLRPVGEERLYPKTEIKNINSFRFVEQAVMYEIARQTELWNQGTPVDRETTRGFNAQTGTTTEQRSKEDAADYRYFPEPDIPPFHLTDEARSAIQRHIPELPWEKHARLMDQFGLSDALATTLTDDKDIANTYEQILSDLVEWVDAFKPEEDVLSRETKALATLAANWMTTELFALLKARGETIQELKPSSENLAELIALLYKKEINSSAGQTVLEHMMETGQDPSQIVEEKGLQQVSDENALGGIIQELLAEHAGPVRDYQNGKEQALQFLVGQVMKATKGAANPQVASELLQAAMADLPKNEE